MGRCLDALVLLAAGLILSDLGSAVAAVTCPPLELLASVPLSRDPDGLPLVPVTLLNTPRLMLVDTGGGFSTLFPSTVDALNLSHERVPVHQYDISGRYSDEAVTVPQFALGNLKANHLQFMIDTNEMPGGIVAGVIGPNILRNYDVEFDFGGNRFDLLSPDHCPGRVVHWQASAVAEIPVTVLPGTGHIIVPVTLDGRVLNGLIDTGAVNTFMPLRIARNQYNLTRRSPRMMGVGSLPNRPQARVFRYRFHTLAFGGVEVFNPVVEAMPDVNRDVGNPDESGPASETAGLEPITIGMNVLGKLHLYIAWQERMLYVTAATGAPAVPPATPAR